MKKYLLSCIALLLFILPARGQETAITREEAEQLLWYQRNYEIQKERADGLQALLDISTSQIEARLSEVVRFDRFWKVLSVAIIIAEIVHVASIIVPCRQR